MYAYDEADQTAAPSNPEAIERFGTQTSDDSYGSQSIVDQWLAEDQHNQALYAESKALWKQMQALLYRTREEREARRKMAVIVGRRLYPEKRRSARPGWKGLWMYFLRESGIPKSSAEDCVRLYLKETGKMIANRTGYTIRQPSDVVRRKSQDFVKRIAPLCTSNLEFNEAIRVFNEWVHEQRAKFAAASRTPTR